MHGFNLNKYLGCFGCSHFFKCEKQLPVNYSMILVVCIKLSLSKIKHNNVEGKKEVNFNYSNSFGVSNDKLKVLLLYTCTSNSALGKL